MLRIPHCLDNRLTDGGEFVSLTSRPRSTHQKNIKKTRKLKHVCLEANTDADVSNQNAGQTIRKIANFFGNVAAFKHMDTTIRNANCINEKITRRLNSGNACLPLISESFAF
jgi:hypothetical protein